MKKSLTILATLALATVAFSASAEDVSLNVSGGPALSLRAPGDHVLTNSRFNLGGGGQADVLFNLTPNLSIGPSASMVYLPQSRANTEESVMWTFDGTIRLQGDRSAGWSPYAQVSGGVAKQSAIYNPALTAQVGVNFALNQEQSVFGGVFLGYQHVFNASSDPSQQTALLDHVDPNIGLAGVSLSFDFPSKHVAPVVHTVVQERVVQHTVMQRVAVPVPVPTKAVEDGTALLLSPIQFDKDSFVVSTDAQTSLTELATHLNNAPKGYMLVIEGYASAEGDTTHNLVLANSRANAVADFLATNGKVDRAMLHPVAFGATGNPNDASNRRVDCIVVRLVKVQ